MLLKFLEDISIIEWILYGIIIAGAITYIVINIVDTIKKNKEKNKK
jgi:hypothetical protein